MKQVFNELRRLHELGYQNWYSQIISLAESYEVDLDRIEHNEAKNIKAKIISQYKVNFMEQLKQPNNSRILKMYSDIKTCFKMENYLNSIREVKYRVALSRLRCSSHILEVERGRHTRPKTPFENRLCPICNIPEDEVHFITQCNLYKCDRKEMLDKIERKYPSTLTLKDIDLFKFLLQHQDPFVLNSLGKFTFRALKSRARIL